jgi:hypothetical protein
MLLIPGILASKFVPQGDFESIATVTVGSGGSATISFTAIPSTYTHLQIRGMTLSATAVNYVRIRFNSDTGTNYTRHLLEGTGSAASAEAATGLTFTPAGYTGASANPSVFVTDILDYKNTNKYTTIRSLSGIDQNGSGFVNFGSGLWLNTAAITSIDITHNSSINFNQYSSFALYGIKG